MMRDRVWGAGAGLLLAAGVLVHGPAMASDPADYGASNGWGVQVGGIVIVSPKYEGSSSYRVLGAPLVAPALSANGRVQVRGPDDVRVRLFQHDGFEAGPLAGWRFGRDEEDGKRLWGLGDVDGGLIVGGYGAYRFGFLKPFLSYHHQVTGDDGGAVLRFGTDMIGNFGPGLEVTGTVGASYADDDYMDAFFSVTQAQAATSVARLQVFDADAGVKDVFVGLSATVPLATAWTLRLSGRYTRLLGDAADSPIVESENQFTAGAGITYRFDLR